MASRRAVPRRALALLATMSLTGGVAANAQRSPPMGPEPPTARVAVLAALLYNDQANLKEASDSGHAELATTVLRARLSEQLGAQVVAPDRVDSLASTPAARELTGGLPCGAKVACARDVGRRLAAPWVAITRVSKTSNLIWLLSAQLIRTSTGEIILDDSTELKGDPAVMVPVGVRQFADRVARTVRQGGYATNYPDGEPQ